MVDRDLPVTDEELHAYIDGELPADRQVTVAAWLAAQPEKAALVAAWQAQSDSIRARYGAAVKEPVPAHLKLDQVIKSTRSNARSWMAIAAAAATVAFIVGGSAGWLARGASARAPTAVDTVTADALGAHRLYVVEVRHPVEVPGTERAHMTQWLSKRLGADLRIPELQAIGLKLVGGRLLPGATGAAAFYMYEGASGERFTIYCAKAKAQETALRFKRDDASAAFYFVDDKVAYVVTGPADRDRLEKVAKTIYEQVDRTGAKKL